MDLGDPDPPRSFRHGNPHFRLLRCAGLAKPPPDIETPELSSDSAGNDFFSCECLKLFHGAAQTDVRRPAPVEHAFSTNSSSSLESEGAGFQVGFGCQWCGHMCPHPPDQDTPGWSTAVLGTSAYGPMRNGLWPVFLVISISRLRHGTTRSAYLIAAAGSTMIMILSDSDRERRGGEGRGGGLFCSQLSSSSLPQAPLQQTPSTGTAKGSYLIARLVLTQCNVVLPEARMYHDRRCDHRPYAARHIMAHCVSVHGPGGTAWVDAHFTTTWSEPESGTTFANVPVRTCRAWTKWGWSALRGVVAVVRWVVGWSCTGLGCVARPEGTGVVGL
eukprot:1632622-Rhodomonas_salina.1